MVTTYTHTMYFLLGLSLGGLMGSKITGLLLRGPKPTLSLSATGLSLLAKFLAELQKQKSSRRPYLPPAVTSKPAPLPHNSEGCHCDFHQLQRRALAAEHELMKTSKDLTVLRAERDLLLKERH